jgi:hypothetical protein
MRGIGLWTLRGEGMMEEIQPRRSRGSRAQAKRGRVFLNTKGAKDAKVWRNGCLEECDSIARSQHFKCLAAAWTLCGKTHSHPGSPSPAHNLRAHTEGLRCLQRFYKPYHFPVSAPKGRCGLEEKLDSCSRCRANRSASAGNYPIEKAGGDPHLGAETDAPPCALSGFGRSSCSMTMENLV